MKKNKLLLLGCLFSVGLFFSTISASATSSQGTIHFEESNSVIPPIDPTDPSLPEEPGGGEEVDPVSINYSSSWNFEIHQISNTDQIYSIHKDVLQMSDGQKKEVPNFIQITDNSGKCEGWNLTIQQDYQFQHENDILDGASVTVKEPKIIALNDGKAPQTLGDVTLPPDGTAVPLVVAKEGQGTGTWLIVFGDDDNANEQITLFVPGKTEKKEGQYHTRFTWTLSTSEV